MLMYYKIFTLMAINFLMMISNSLSIYIYMLLMMIMIVPFNYKFMNPLMINLNIIGLTLILSLYLNSINKTNWFSILIFLVMIGGMMILFLYLNSFAINESSPLNFLFLKNFELKLMIFLFLNMILSNSYSLTYLMNNSFYSKFNMMINLINEPTIMTIFHNNLNLMLIFMIIYLLISLIVVTYICMSKKSSMRKMN